MPAKVFVGGEDGRADGSVSVGESVHGRMIVGQARRSCHLRNRVLGAS
jgi:hypothetical protein